MDGYEFIADIEICLGSLYVLYSRRDWQEISKEDIFFIDYRWRFQKMYLNLQTIKIDHK